VDRWGFARPPSPGIFLHLSDDRRIAPQGVVFHSPKNRFGSLGLHDGDQLPLVGQVPGLKPQELTGTRTSSFTGIRFSSTQIPTPD